MIINNALNEIGKHEAEELQEEQEVVGVGADQEAKYEAKAMKNNELS